MGLKASRLGVHREIDLDAIILSRPPAHEVVHVGRILKPDEPAPRRGHKVIAVLPAYNAEKTLAAILADFPAGCVDEILLVDDGSLDGSFAVLEGLAADQVHRVRQADGR